MASVFAEANVAREKEREVLREKHVQVLTSIEETKCAQYCMGDL